MDGDKDGGLTLNPMLRNWLFIIAATTAYVMRYEHVPWWSGICAGIAVILGLQLLIPFGIVVYVIVMAPILCLRDKLFERAGKK